MKHLHNLVSLLVIFSFAWLISCDNPVKNGNPHENKAAEQADTTIHYPQEKHLANIRQLTNGGDNAEAYFSFNNEMIVFQAKNTDWNAPCDQIYTFSFSDVKVSCLSTPFVLNNTIIKHNIKAVKITENKKTNSLLIPFFVLISLVKRIFEEMGELLFISITLSVNGTSI